MVGEKEKKGGVSLSSRILKQRTKGAGEGQAQCQIGAEKRANVIIYGRPSQWEERAALDSRRTSSIRKE